MASAASYAEILQDGATVAIIGGGPAGAFLAIHLLRLARQSQQTLKVFVFERRRAVPRQDPSSLYGPYKGCPQCAGGISPRLLDALRQLDIRIPDAVLQCEVHSITVQGDWKPVHLHVPESRRMLSVYRGILPAGGSVRHEAFDALLLDTARDRGAEIIGGRVNRAYYDAERRPVVCYEIDRECRELVADFVAFAGGVNERADPRVGRRSAVELFQMLQPAYAPPRLRKALIVEVGTPPDCSEALEGGLHYIEGSLGELRLEMCSIMPKRGYHTLSLIGDSVDESTSHKANMAVIHQFLETPRVRQILPAGPTPEIRCVCNPWIVIGNAKMPWAHRAAVVGDLATSRQYKDGILAAHETARDLASVAFLCGVDLESLASDYAATLTRFGRDNRFASLIFFLYRWFFVSPTLSRVIYQTFATERKREHSSRRSFERIFWAISSGDQNYEQIAWEMLRPSTLWKILSGGVYITLRNWVTERFFGLDWDQMGRFPTAVPVEVLRARRLRLMQGRRSEFECTYTIGLRSGPEAARRLLAEFGEASRPYLNPRWVRIRRVDGEPLQPGCRIEYRVFGGLLSFTIRQEESGDENVVRYRVTGGFADGGFLIFAIDPESASRCSLSVYLAFDYARGHTWTGQLFWGAFRFLFPEYLHDVLWNHAFCEIRQLAEEGWPVEAEPLQQLTR